MKSKIDVSEWIKRSLENLESAKATLERGLYNNSVFHSHQAIELILKAAWLRFLRRLPPTGRRGHMLHSLYTTSLRKYVKLTKKETEFLIELSPHYLNSRYPELLWEATSSYAKNTLEKAEVIVKCFVKKLS